MTGSHQLVRTSLLYTWPTCLSGLNKLKRSGLREPDVDSHVDILQVLADSYLVNQVTPGKLLILDMGMVTCGGLCS